MFREETDFINNAIGVDPANCGCVDCIVGNSLPEGDPRIPELIQEHFTEGRKIVNRTYSSILIAYKSGNGEYTYDALSLPDPAAEVRVIEPEESSYDGEGVVICESDDDGYEPMLRADEDPDDTTVISRYDEDAMEKAAEKHFQFGKRIINRTHSAIVFHESYGNYGYVTIDARRGKVSIIR
jgi:hypothetical protein